MIRFTRKGTLKNATLAPKAIGWATELNSYVNEKYDVELHFGIEMFNQLNMTWYMDFDNLGDVEAFNGQLMMDQDYWTQIDKAADFWVDGSLRDTIVNLFA